MGEKPRLAPPTPLGMTKAEFDRLPPGTTIKLVNKTTGEVINVRKGQIDARKRKVVVTITDEEIKNADTFKDFKDLERFAK